MCKPSESIFIVYFGVCGFLYAESESRSGLVEAARTQKEANLTPDTPPKGEIRIESIEHSLPYRLLTGEVDGFGVGISNIVPGSSVAAGRNTGVAIYWAADSRLWSRREFR